MIFLLPPSESKLTGGSSIQPKLSFPTLDQTRNSIRKALIELSKSPKPAALALKLGPRQMGELQVNLDLVRPATLPAIHRYTGVLYDALKITNFTKPQLSRVSKTLFIQSSLFGLISALDEIPNYRMSAGSRLPGINLRSVWAAAHQSVWEKFKSETVIDLRSKAYAALAPIPDYIDAYEVQVLTEDGSGKRKALNHFNKEAKGSFLRAAISLADKPTKLGDLREAAKLCGLKLEIQGRTLLLITNS
jgi:cytoplasmic iron level regulating protein YaaA (DUF328/UPF0246 family)